MTAPRLLDLRGLRCPWPALRVGRALREGETPLLAVADDPLAATEIAAVADARGWTITPSPSQWGPALLILRNER